jgi:hypothetical protein
LLKKEGFAKHKSIDATTLRKEATASWHDLIIPLVTAGLDRDIVIVTTNVRPLIMWPFPKIETMHTFVWAAS